MELDALRTFVDVVRRGSFAAVARERDLDPSSVSRQVASLETALGFRLFERTTRRLAPTEAGRRYHERVAPLVEALELAAEEAGDVVGTLRGRLRITASVAFGERWLVPRLAPFRRAHPELELELALDDAAVDLVAGGIDVGVRLGARMSGSLVATRLLDTRYRIVASPAYLEARGRPPTPAALADHDGLGFPLPGYRSRWRLRDTDGAVETVEVRASITVSNALALRRAALEGLGVALLADWLIDADVAAGALVELFADRDASAADFDTAAWIVYPDRSYVPAKVRALIDHLKGGRGPPSGGDARGARR